MFAPQTSPVAEFMNQQFARTLVQGADAIARMCANAPQPGDSKLVDDLCDAMRHAAATVIGNDAAGLQDDTTPEFPWGLDGLPDMPGDDPAAPTDSMGDPTGEPADDGTTDDKPTN